MTRPPAKKSGLAGLGAVNPSTPPTERAGADSGNKTPEKPSEPVQTDERRAERNDKGKRKYRNKVAFYINEDDAARARAALAETATPSREGMRSFSQMIVDALMKEVQRLEGEYNSGEQWPPLEAWQMPQGRPKGS